MWEFRGGELSQPLTRRNKQISTVVALADNYELMRKITYSQIIIWLEWLRSRPSDKRNLDTQWITVGIKTRSHKKVSKITNKLRSDLTILCTSWLYFSNYIGLCIFFLYLVTRHLNIVFIICHNNNNTK